MKQHTKVEDLTDKHRIFSGENLMRCDGMDTRSIKNSGFHDAVQCFNYCLRSRLKPENQAQVQSEVMP